jgi:ABC-type multidrug transport system ATPase subunit
VTSSSDEPADKTKATGQAEKPRPARRSPSDAAKTAAVKARATSGQAAGSSAKSATAKAAASKTSAAKAAANKATAAKSAAKTTAAKTAAAKTAAAKTAATKAAATKAAAAEAKAAAKKAAEAEAAEAKVSDAKAAETKAADAKAAEAEVAHIDVADVSEDAAGDAASTAAAPKPAAKKRAPVKKPAPKRTSSAGRSSRARAVAAESAAPVVETVSETSVGTALPVAVQEEVTDEAAVDVDADVVSDDASVAAAEPIDDVEVHADAAQVAEIEATAEVAPADAPESGIAAAADDAFADVHSDSATQALSVRGVTKDFGDHRAVNGVDLTVPAGSFYGIVGPNGAGKTTTLSIIAGLLRPDAGTVHVSGIDQAAEPLAAKRVLGVLPDRLRTFDRLTGRQLLHYYGLLRGLDPAVIEKRSADLARAFDLSGALSRVVSDYSAGMTKKIMLAGAMIHSPRVLVLDEPFEAVDPVSSGVILEILRAYVSHGGTVILSSHGMDLVERVCSRVAIIVGGEVLAEGTVDDVRAGQSLESRLVELAGSSSEVEGLEWLHTFSD